MSYARASDAQKAERLNRARTLLRTHALLPETAERLARDWSVSKRQAYRNLQQAQKLKQPVPVGLWYVEEPARRVKGILISRGGPSRANEHRPVLANSGLEPANKVTSF